MKRTLLWPEQASELVENGRIREHGLDLGTSSIRDLSENIESTMTVMENQASQCTIAY